MAQAFSTLCKVSVHKKIVVSLAIAGVLVLVSCADTIPGLVRLQRDCIGVVYAQASLQPIDQGEGVVQQYRSTDGGIKEFTAKRYPKTTPEIGIERFPEGSGATKNDVDCTEMSEEEYTDVATGFRFNSRMSVFEGYKDEPVGEQKIDYIITTYLADDMRIEGEFRVDHKILPTYYEAIPMLTIGDKAFTNVVVATNYAADDEKVTLGSAAGQNTVVSDDKIVDEIILVRDMGLMQYRLRSGEIYTRVDAYN